MTTELTTTCYPLLGPVEIDTKLAELHEEHAKLRSRVQAAASSIYYGAGARKVYRRGQPTTWDKTFDECVAKLREQADRGGSYVGTWQSHEAQSSLASYTTALEAAEAKLAEVAEWDKLYTGWSRFFLVTSSAGHIHSSMNCPTCRWTTTYGWLPSLSGKSQAEAIEFFGPAAECLCSVCFPDAPTKDRNLTAAEQKSLLAGVTPEAKAETVYCPGSGEPSATEVNYRLMRPRGRCKHCRYVGVVTQYGRIRKHKAAS